MRICLFNLTAGFKTGGLETFTWGLAEALLALGHDVEVVAGKGDRNSASERIPLVRFDYRPRNTFPNLGTRFRKMAERLSFAQNAFGYVRDGNFDVVLINKPYDFPVLWLLKRSGFSGVTCYNSGGTEFYLGDRWFSRAVDLWLPCSEYNAGKIREHYGCSYFVLNNGVDIDRFCPEGQNRDLRTQYSIPEGGAVVVSVGRLIGLKGFQVIVEAMRHLPDLHYVLVGDGQERKRLEALSCELHLTERVHFVGEVPHAELPELLRASTIFVQPSIGEEAFGISVAEAMACGLPVLASNGWGLREVVVDRETGLLLEPGNVDAWVQALRHLANNRALGKLMGRAGRQRAVNLFTWTRAAETLEQNVSQLLARRCSPFSK